MTVSITSAQAYREIQGDGTTATQTEKILAFLRSSDSPVTRREAGEATGMELGAVAGRVNELIKSKVVVECGKTTDPKTNRKVHMIKLLGVG